MGDVSNKTLAILVGVAIVVSIIGLLSVGRGGITYITARAGSGEGPVSVNLTSEISILVTDSIDFGNGRVNSTATNATLDSDAGTVDGGSWTPITEYIKIENDGTVNISVNVSADGDNNANGLIGGTSPAFQLKGIETEVSSCTTLQTSYSNVPNSTETPLQLCDILKHGLTEDEFNVSAKLVVPSDADVGQRNATLTFSAAQA